MQTDKQNSHADETEPESLFEAGHGGVPGWLKLLWAGFAVWIVIYLSQNLKF